MIIAPPHPKEEERLEELDALDILDTVSEQSYDDLVALASTICETPIALISLVDKDRQWFKSRVGLQVPETSRDVAFCSHAILEEGLLIVPDPKQDERFAQNPLVWGEPHVGFYAGVPLFSEEVPLGTLCVIDHQPRQLDDAQLKSLGRLARQIEKLFSLRKQVVALQRAQHQQDEFISMINHELRTPLTSLLGTISLLNSNKIVPLPKDAHALLSIAKRNGHRLLSVVNDILDTSALSAGQFNQSPERFDLTSCIRQCLQLNKAEAKKATRQFKFIADVPHAYVIADPHRIGQVLQNLLSNALKYSFEHSTIEIAIQQVEGMHKVTVTNKGPGIPREEQSQIFERFFRSRNEYKGNPQGTGLGLYISKKIIHLSDGDIGFQSVPDETTSFWFALPIAPSTDQD